MNRIKDSKLWKLTPNEKYWVSEYGEIESIRSGELLKCTVSSVGYAVVSSSVMGKTDSVHRVVFKTFVGEIPDKLQINHIDGNKLNNHITNLEVVTASENVRHAFDTGLHSIPFGENNGMHELKEYEVLEMYQLIKKGLTNKDLADIYGVHDRYVSLIRHGHRWKYLFEREGMKPMKSLGNLRMPLAKAVYIYNMCLTSEKGQDRLGPELGIDPSTVSRVRTGKSWKDFRIFFGVPALSEDWKDNRNNLTVNH